MAYYNAMHNTASENSGEYQLHFAVARWGAPFGFVGVACDEREIIRVSYLPQSAGELPPQNYLAKEANKQLRAYFAKPRGHRFDLPLRRAPTPHQRKVREVMFDIPSGECITYGEIAQRIGKPRGARAVGQACKRNPAALIVPCHRVVAACDIGGYIGGGADVPIKRWLLHHEGVKHL